tara:strand:- start:494 stop:766 length:273 start_codon:yes stop_codon:yes gene_type:complete
MNIETLAPFLAGPGAAVIVLLCVFAAVYRLSVVYLVPLAAGALERHLQQVDTIATRIDGIQARHTLEHERILTTIDAMHAAIVQELRAVV